MHSTPHVSQTSQTSHTPHSTAEHDRSGATKKRKVLGPVTHHPSPIKLLSLALANLPDVPMTLWPWFYGTRVIARKERREDATGHDGPRHPSEKVKNSAIAFSHVPKESRDEPRPINLTLSRWMIDEQSHSTRLGRVSASSADLIINGTGENSRGHRTW